MLQCYCNAVLWKSSAMVMQCYSDLFNSAIDLLFCYEVAYRHTEPLLEILADLKRTHSTWKMMHSTKHAQCIVYFGLPHFDSW